MYTIVLLFSTPSSAIIGSALVYGSVPEGMHGDLGATVPNPAMTDGEVDCSTLAALDNAFLASSESIYSTAGIPH
tara:strand:+ start:753 stop:977 length:225 start_codon:yes stop_codon:yes gene_type:complete